MPAAMASPGEANVTSLPSIWIVPAVGWSTPNRTRAISVRPLPTRPPKPRISPARTSSETSAKAPSRARPVAASTTAPGVASRTGYMLLSERPTISRTARSRGISSVGAVATRLAVAQHGDAIGDAVDLVHAMADEHHRHALPAQLVDDREQPVDLALRQGGGGLVHDQDAGARPTAHGRSRPAAARSCAGPASGASGSAGEADRAEQPGRLASASAPGRAGPAPRSGHGR